MTLLTMVNDPWSMRPFKPKSWPVKLNKTHQINETNEATRQTSQPDQPDRRNRPDKPDRPDRRNRPNGRNRPDRRDRPKEPTGLWFLHELHKLHELYNPGALVMVKCKKVFIPSDDKVGLGKDRAFVGSDCPLHQREHGGEVRSSGQWQFC